MTKFVAGLRMALTRSPLPPTPYHSSTKSFAVGENLLMSFIVAFVVCNCNCSIGLLALPLRPRLPLYLPYLIENSQFQLDLSRCCVHDELCIYHEPL